MGEPPKGLTLERIDNNGDYEPGNCKWATWQEQQRNSRNCRPITFEGKTQLLVDWARELNIPAALISGRLAAGWSLEKALSAERFSGSLEVHRHKDNDGKSIHAKTAGQLGGIIRAAIGRRDEKGRFA